MNPKIEPLLKTLENGCQALAKTTGAVRERLDLHSLKLLEQGMIGPNDRHLLPKPAQR